jgi:hypothetical protein
MRDLKGMKEVKQSNVRLFLYGMIPDLNYNDFNGGYVNAYINHEGKGNNPYHFYLLVKKDFPNTLEFNYFDGQMILKKTFIEREEVGEYYVLYTHKVLPEYKKDFDLIIRGKYSRISHNYKQQILVSTNTTFGGKTDKTSKLYMVLYRAPKYREALEDKLNVNIDLDAELYEVPEMNGIDMFRYSDVI